MGGCCSQEYHGPVLYVRIVEAKGLSVVTGEEKDDNSVNPYCKVKLANVSPASENSKTAQSDTIDEDSTPLWNFKTKFNFAKRDLDTGSLVVTVHNKKTLSDSNIGTASLNCSIFKANTKFEGWVQLRNDKKELIPCHVFIKAVYADHTAQGGILNITTKKDRKKSYPIQMYCLTFNCGNGDLNDLYKWIPKNSNYDMYVISHQENYMTEKDMHDQEQNKDVLSDDEHKVSKSGFMEKLGDAVFNDQKNEESNSQQSEFIRLALNHLNGDIKEDDKKSDSSNNNSNKYYCIENHKLFMIRLFVFCKLKYRDRISNISHMQEVTGFFNIVRNKGCVGVSFDFDGTSFGIIGAHLAAHQHKMHDRNSMYKQICSKRPSYSYKFHHIIWLGDLNYRVDYKGRGDHPKSPNKKTWNEYVNLVKSLYNNGQGKDYQELIKDDQLHYSMNPKKNLAFYGFNEGGIHFPPTFKLEKNGKENLLYIHERLPAWADRILWKSHSEFKNDLKLSEYGSLLNVRCSDHTPVYGIINVTINAQNVASINDLCRHCYIKFSEIDGSKLRNVGAKDKVDAYVYVSKQALVRKSMQITKSIDDERNPHWENSNDSHQIEEIPLKKNDLVYLENALLALQVRDNDVVTGDDIVGYGALGLKPFAQNINKEIEFNIQLVAQGVYSGTLSGKATLVYETR